MQPKTTIKCLDSHLNFFGSWQMLKSVDKVQQAVTSSLQLRDNAAAHLSLLTHILMFVSMFVCCLFVCLLSVYLPDVDDGS